MLAIKPICSLLKNVRWRSPPAMPTSNRWWRCCSASVLPVNRWRRAEWLALVIIVAAVVLVTLGKYPFARPANVQPSTANGDDHKGRSAGRR